MRRNEQRVAVVTGAGSRIGREIALRYARIGVRVALIDRNEESLLGTAA